MRGKLRLLTAAACAVVAVLASGAYASGVQAQADQERSEMLERYGGEVTRIVVATRELDAGQTLSTSDVELRDWISDMVPEGSFSSVDAIVGRVLTSPVAEGLPLTQTSMREGESAIDVPRGQVATSVSLSDKLGLADGVAAGERLLAYESDGETTRLVSDSVTVLAVDEGQAALSGGGSVTLAMSPSVVNELLRCSSAGSLRLVLPADDVDADELEANEAPTSVEPLEDSDDQDGSEQAESSETDALSVEQPAESDSNVDGGVDDAE